MLDFWSVIDGIIDGLLGEQWGGWSVWWESQKKPTQNGD